VTCLYSNLPLLAARVDYGWWSLAPPLIAITAAIATRRVLLSLLLGVLLGALILQQGNLLLAVAATCERFIWKQLIEEDHLRVFAFTLLMGAMVGVIYQSGGMRDLADRLARLASTRRRGQVTTWLLGLVIFFDDYCNTLLLGSTMRPLTDRLRISREKLAYLVDSTAAPVAGLAVISTWIAGEIGYLDSGLQGLVFSGSQPSGFGLFIASIPYRYYVLFALLMVLLVGLLGRDFGPMLRAERRALREKPETPEETIDAEDSSTTGQGHWSTAIVPVVITILGTVGVYVLTLGELFEGNRAWYEVVGGGDSYIALLYGSLAGLITAVVMAMLQGRTPLSEIQAAAGRGAALMLPSLAILLFAWALSSTTDEKHLATGQFLGSLLGQHVGALWLPTVVFLLSSAVAFSTGTSWGTMALLVPLVIRTAHAVLLEADGGVAAGDPLLLACVGGVLAGAIFGDHCSPISDTTVLSSRASGCDHVSHVRTQLPYAVASAAVSIVCGTIPVALGLPVYAALGIGTAAVVGVLLVFGRSAEEQ